MLFYVGFMLFMAISFYMAMKRIMRRDNYINSLIKAFLEEGTLSKKELLDKMYDYGCQDFRLKRIIEKYHATRQDYENIFDKLFHWANFRKRRRYIPINSFFFVSSLETILKHKDIDSKKLTQKMMNHFHF